MTEGKQVTITLSFKVTEDVPHEDLHELGQRLWFGVPGILAGLRYQRGGGVAPLCGGLCGEIDVKTKIEPMKEKTS